MLTRRGFAGFASCAICAVTGFMATDASAQGAPPAATAGVTRKILSRTDGPATGFETIVIEGTVEPGTPVGRHTHPGVESAFILEGEIVLDVDGQPTKTYKTGDAYQVPTGVVHGGKNGAARTRFVSTYVVEKGKPLASPA